MNELSLKNLPGEVWKPIKCLDLKTNVITVYPSYHEAERKTNISRAAISHNIKTKYPYKNRYVFSKV